jgi:hypothetical protein
VTKQQLTFWVAMIGVRRGIAAGELKAEIPINCGMYRNLAFGLEGMLSDVS